MMSSGLKNIHSRIEHFLESPKREDYDTIEEFEDAYNEY